MAPFFKTSSCFNESFNLQLIHFLLGSHLSLLVEQGTNFKKRAGEGTDLGARVLF